MTRSLTRFAALSLCAGLLFTLFTGCAPAAPASSEAPASSVTAESDAPAPTMIPLPDPLPEPFQPTEEELAALTDAIEAGFRADWDRPGRYLTARLDSVRVIPPEEWEDLELPLADGNTHLEGKSWMDCIADPGGCLLMAQTTTEYTPEALVGVPQYSDGVMTHVYLAVNGDEGWTIADQWGNYKGSELPEPSPDPAQEELGLTRNQWLMLQNQTRALALSGIFRDLNVPLNDLTSEEWANYLYARSESWSGLTGEGRTETPVGSIFRADFTDRISGENPTPAALENAEEPLPAPCAAYEEIKALLNADPNAIVYERTGDVVTATLTLPLESGTVAMEYTFGLVPDDPAPFSRTYLQSARRA